MRIDATKNTNADMLIPGNILHVGSNTVTYKITQDKQSLEIKQNLLISTNVSHHNCESAPIPGPHCGVLFIMHDNDLAAK